jgi:uncharacterized protein (DUF433 family)
MSDPHNTLLARDGISAEILAEYMGLTREDLQACVLIAARPLEHTTFMPVITEQA